MNYLTVKEAAEKLRISRATMYKVMKINGFPKINIGNRVIIPEDLLISFVNDYVEGKITLFQ